MDSRKTSPQILNTNPLLKNVQKLGEMMNIFSDDDDDDDDDDHDIGEDEYSETLNGAGLFTYMNAWFVWQIWKK